MMWNIKDVRVGYDIDAAKRFNLEGKDTQDIVEVLPKLKVDGDLPYMRNRRKT